MNPETRSIIRFMTRALLAVLPIPLLFVTLYLVADPFKVVWPHTDYFPDPAEQPLRIGVNKGMVSLDTYTRLTAEGRRFDSFIFGSSISCAYDARLWASLLTDSVVTPSAIHLDSSGEPIESMAAKAAWLDRNGADIRHALIVLDPKVLHNRPSDAPFAIDPPQLQPGIIPWLRFHYTFFRAATNADFLKSYIPGLITGRPIDNGRNPVFEPQPIVYDPAVNEETIPLWDSLISADAAAFHSLRPLPPPPAYFTETTPAITPERANLLRDMAARFARHATDCRIIISPNRTKITISRADLDTLRSIFGARNVYDYTRSEATALEADSMLFDPVHYRRPFATRLLRLTYPAQ